MPKPILAAFAVLFLLVTPAVAAEPWVTFANRELGFSVDLPGKPEASSMPLQDTDLQIHTFLVEQEDRAIVVGAVPFPTGLDFDLDEAVKGAVGNSGGRIITQESITVSGRDARRVKYVGTESGESFTAWYLVVANDKTAYSALVIQIGTPDEAAALRVVNSFRLIG